MRYFKGLSSLLALLASLGLLSVALPRTATATEYLQASMANYRVSWAGKSASLHGSELRYGSYLTKKWMIEGVLGFGGKEETIIQEGPTGVLPKDVLGRASTFDNMSTAIDLDNLLGFYVGYRKIVGNTDWLARLGLVYLRYSQPFHARNAVINGASQVAYEENVGGSSLGFSLGVGMAYWVTRSGALSLELLSLPPVDDTVFGAGVDGGAQSHYGTVNAFAILAGVRFHF